MQYIYAILILSLLSCGKDKVDSSPLNLGSYKAVSLIYNPAIDYNKDGILDVECINFIEDCSKDDLITFTSSTEGVFNPGTNKCFSSEKQIKFTWSMLDNNTKFIYRYEGSTDYDTLIIEIVNKNEFIDIFKEDNGTKIDYYTARERFVRQ